MHLFPQKPNSKINRLSTMLPLSKRCLLGKTGSFWRWVSGGGERVSGEGEGG
jgi:hypothetical protein